MFTGIVKGLCPVIQVDQKPGLMRYSIEFEGALLEGLERGASVAIDGVCQTVVEIQEKNVSFDAIEETLKRTTIKHLQVGSKVNVERSVCYGDEVGGHVLSGHVFGTVLIKDIRTSENNHEVRFQCLPEWMKYILSKGFIALDGASLTIVDTDPSGEFTVHLIPETLRLTTFGFKQAGDSVNLEFDTITQAIVETVERVLKERVLV